MTTTRVSPPVSLPDTGYEYARPSPPARPRGPLAAATLVHAAVASLLLAGAFGAWVAVERESAFDALLWLLTGGCVYVAIALAARDSTRWRNAALGLTTAGALVAAYAILQYRYLEYPDKVWIVTSLGWITSGGMPSLGGWAPFPNSLATAVEGLLPLALGLALGSGAPRLRRAAWVTLGLMTLGLLLSASRGGWMAEATIIGAWILAARARGRSAWLATGAACVAAGLTIATVVLLLGAWSSAPAAAGPDAASTVNAVSWWTAIDRPDRLDVYRHSLTLVEEFPFTGIGLGDQFAMALAGHALLIEVPFLTYPHNLFLDLWLELGLPGVATWVTLIAVVLIGGIAGERVGLGLGFRGAYLGLLATLVHGLTDARQSVDAWTWLPLFALLGLMAARLQRFQVRVGRLAVVVAALTPAMLLLVMGMNLRPDGAAWHVNMGALEELRARAAGDASDVAAVATASAEAAYRAALAQDDRQPTAHRRLGLLAMRRGNFAEAVRHLEAATAVDPHNWTNRKALGFACTWTGNIDRASRMLRSLESPELPGELNAWSGWREARGELTLARYAAQVSLRLRPDPAVEQRIARLTRQP